MLLIDSSVIALVSVVHVHVVRQDILAFQYKRHQKMHQPKSADQLLENTKWIHRRVKDCNIVGAPYTYEVTLSCFDGWRGFFLLGR